MAVSVSRMQFLRGDFGGRRRAQRPPWALTEPDFLAACSRCDLCIRVCPEQILLRGPGGYPAVDFTRGECTFCRACLEQCATGALRSEDPASPPWRLKARIGEDCIVHHSVVCSACREQCAANAIHFRHRIGAVPQPEIHHHACTGCGACVRPCPGGAVSLVPDESMEVLE